jgi:hypothetical protein
MALYGDNWEDLGWEQQRRHFLKHGLSGTPFGTIDEYINYRMEGDSQPTRQDSLDLYNKSQEERKFYMEYTALAKDYTLKEIDSLYTNSIGVLPRYKSDLPTYGDGRIKPVGYTGGDDKALGLNVMNIPLYPKPSTPTRQTISPVGTMTPRQADVKSESTGSLYTGEFTPPKINTEPVRYRRSDISADNIRGKTSGYNN